jgi:threonine/homoserine/homoserine lactone efflux protein
LTGQAIGEVLALGVGVALSPLASVAMVSLLVRDGGRASAVAYAVAWIGALAVVAGVVTVAADLADASDDGAPATWASLLKLAVAVLLLWFAARKWRGRPAPGAVAEPPAWMQRLNALRVPQAFVLGVLFAVVKPKNLLLSISAGLAVAQVGASPGGQGAAVATFALIGSAGIWAPLAVAVASPERGREALLGLREWMERENAAVIAVLCVVFAAKLLGDALVALS